jgi:hypothetical protein
MNVKRVLALALAFLALLALAAGIRMAQSPAVAAEALRVPPSLPPARPAQAEMARPRAVPDLAPPVETVSGAVLTQTFTLQAGWNAIYLGVEPINSSPLVNKGTTDKPQWVHEKSLMEAVFGGLAANGALESVWTYNQPASHKDYIVDPGEGLWDAPGWLRYVPKENLGPDTVSREFLSTLVTLHANTGYLVKLKDGVSGTVQVYGRPVPGHHRWQAGGYNLAGFPLTAAGTTVATFTAGSPITEVRALTSDGKWTNPLGGANSLVAGTAYLVRYADEPSTPNYTAPLDVANAPSEGLAFQGGTLGQKITLLAKNSAAAPISVTLKLPEGAASKVALHYIGGTTVDLRSGPVALTLAAHSGKQLQLQVPVNEQPAAGEALLEISSADLGTRWLIPIAAEPGSYAGLWVGDVIVNDVSEARLGATDFTNDLTVALKPVNASGVAGSTQIHETISGVDHTLAFTVSLSLPELPVETVEQVIPDPTYVHGYVYVDENQNGQRDVGEPGLINTYVKFQGNTAIYVQADGSYVKKLNPNYYYTVYAAGAGATGYTTVYSVTLPAATTLGAPVKASNFVPNRIGLRSWGLFLVQPPEYLTQTLGQTTLPYYDLNDNKIEPPLNFGYIRQDVAAVYEGSCDAPGAKLFDLGNVNNGHLATSVTGHTLSELEGVTNVRVTWNGATVACGNLVIGSPTQFADGRGSSARFRVILRVNKTDGQTALLPYYAVSDNQRISTAVFLSLQKPITITGPFGVTGSGLEYDFTLPANDPLNPYKHKYNPDHDNLDAKFQGYQEEAFDVQRKVTFVLTELPYDGDAAAAASLDWGGAVWGGDYREVVANLHKNSITARGYFVIRHVLTADQLVKQAYDK